MNQFPLRYLLLVKNFYTFAGSDDGIGSEVEEEAMFDNAWLLTNGLSQLLGVADGGKVAVEDDVVFVGDEG